MSSWYAIRTLPQQERTFTARLERQGFAAFCPVEKIEKRQRHSTRRGKVTVGLVTRPLLVGYTLACMADDAYAWRALRDTRGFLAVVGIDGRPMPIPMHQVHHLRGLNGMAVKRFEKGSRAKIVAGPFVGHIVKVETVADKRVRVLLGMFGAEREIDVRQEQLEAA